MMDAITEIKRRAEILQRRIEAQDSAATAQLGVLPERPEHVRRQDCLTVVAREMGFSNRPAVRRALTGEAADEAGDLLFPKHCASHFNRWYKTHEEASAIRQEMGGYLLAFRRPFVVVDRYHIEDLGLDPEDADWRAMEYDWARGDGAARARFYAKLVAARSHAQ